MPRRSLVWGAAVGSVVGAVFLALLLTIWRSPAPNNGPAARDVSSSEAAVTVGARFVPCWFDNAGDPAARCGVLTVPEHWGAPRARALQLKFVVFPGAASPQAEPTVYVSGGPGEPAGIDAAAIGGWRSLIERTAWLKDRDLVIFDPRGVGLSEPNMTCPELAEAGRHVFLEPLSVAAVNLLWADAARRCHDRLAQSLDLFAYDTAAMAEDLHALIAQLGYRSWDLLAVSYGTRVALSFLDRWRHGTRAAILDSVWPLSVDAVAEGAEGTADAFTRLFASCAADKSCNDSFPDLAASFAAVVRQAATSPVVVRIADPSGGPPLEARLDDGKLIEVLFYAFYDWRRIATLPATIAALATGNTAPLSDLARIAYANYVSESLSYGLYLSVICRDQFPAEGQAAVERAAAGFPLYRDFALANLAVAACPAWRRGAAAPPAARFEANDVPILMLSGELDPVTPPRWAKAAAERLPHAVSLRFPGIGHGILGADDCASLIIGRFLGDPAKPPFDPCLLGLRPPQFQAASTGN